MPSTAPADVIIPEIRTWLLIPAATPHCRAKRWATVVHQESADPASRWTWVPVSLRRLGVGGEARTPFPSSTQAGLPQSWKLSALPRRHRVQRRQRQSRRGLLDERLGMRLERLFG